MAQCAPTLGNLDQNLAMHLDLVEEATAAKADVVVFPELSLTGYLLKDQVTDVALDPESPQLRPLIEASRDIDIAVGLVLKSAEFQYYNAALYLSRGEVRHVHRKVYLPTYGMFDEQRYFGAGDRIRAFEHQGFSTGMLVCEDMWHLSTPYLLFVQGAGLVFCMSSSPGRGVLASPDADVAPGTVRAWHALVRTVAEYCGCYVVYCNRLGYEDGVTFWGGSEVVGPDGSVVVDAGDVAGLHYAEIDAREVERQRLATPLLRDEKVDFTLRELERIWNERTSDPY